MKHMSELDSIRLMYRQSQLAEITPTVSAARRLVTQLSGMTDVEFEDFLERAMERQSHRSARELIDDSA